MAEILSLQSERVNDISVIPGFRHKLGMADIPNPTLGTQGLRLGLANGQHGVGRTNELAIGADQYRLAWRTQVIDTSPEQLTLAQGAAHFRVVRSA